VKIQTGFLDHFSNKLGFSVDFIVLGVGKQNPILFFVSHILISLFLA